MKLLKKFAKNWARSRWKVFNVFPIWASARWRHDKTPSSVNLLFEFEWKSQPNVFKNQQNERIFLQVYILKGNKMVSRSIWINLHSFVFQRVKLHSPYGLKQLQTLWTNKLNVQINSKLTRNHLINKYI